MKIEFSISWVDDNRDFVDSLKPRLTKWMDEHGFELTVHFHPGGATILDDLKNKQIELLVLDYNMPRMKGDEVIKNVRDNGHYQDIIFYSQDGLDKIVFEKHPDGVFFVNKTDTLARIKDIVGLKIRRASDLPTLRGWIVADSIELELMLERVLGKCFEDKEALFIERVLEHEGLFDFYKKHQVLNGILKDSIAKLDEKNPKSEKLAQLRECKKLMDVFPDDIVHVRNALAHQTAKLSPQGTLKVRARGKAKEIEITPEKCAEIRQNIRRHRDNFIVLEKLVCGK